MIAVVRMIVVVAAIGLGVGSTAGCGGGDAASAGRFVKSKSLTAQDLASTPDDKVEEAVFEAVYPALGDDPGREGEMLAKLPVGAQAVYATTYVEAEVSNGGFNQYFWNSEGRTAEAAVRGYELLKMPKHAESVRKAIAVWKGERANQEKFKSKNTVEAFSESYKETQLSKLDEPFFDLEKIEDPEKLRRAFIRKSPEKCVPVR